MQMPGYPRPGDRGYIYADVVPLGLKRFIQELLRLVYRPEQIQSFILF